MRIIFSFVLFFVFINCFSQDDNPDYRSKRDNFSKLTEKDIRSDVATFSMAGIDESVGKNKLQSVPITNYTANSITFDNDDVFVKITAEPFDPSKHKMGYYDKFLGKIDNKAYYGSYGTVPKTQIQSITVVIDQDTVAIPSTAYVDLYNPDFAYTDASTGQVKSHNNVLLSSDKHKLYIYMLSQDTNGSYEVTWVIQDKKYLRRVVDFGLLK